MDSEQGRLHHGAGSATSISSPNSECRSCGGGAKQDGSKWLATTRTDRTWTARRPAGDPLLDLLTLLTHDTTSLFLGDVEVLASVNSIERPKLTTSARFLA